jgi:hypothetical protein
MQYILERLKEPASWVGIFSLIAGAVGYTFTPELADAIAGVGMAVSSLALILSRGPQS